MINQSLYVGVIDRDERLCNIIMDIVTKIDLFKIEVSYLEYSENTSTVILDNKFDLYILNESFFQLLEHSTWGITNPIIIVGEGKYEDNAIELGAANYIRKTELSKVKLTKSIKYAIERSELRKKNRLLHNRKEQELKRLLNQQNKIIQGIKYAKLIQDALLVDRKELLRLFSDAAIIYRPRDIVSGDFYFAKETNGVQYLAVADCTGHGVPGAFMSIMCNDILKRAIKKHSEPSQILTFIKTIIGSELKKDEDSLITDGMDIAIISIDRTNRLLKFSGAYRPLLLSNKRQTTEIKGNKISLDLSSHTNNSPFTQYEYNYKPGDRCFLYTDGLIDQFGGLQQKKYTKRRLAELIDHHSDKSLADVQKMLINDLDLWQGTEDQIDDILLIGIEL